MLLVTKIHLRRELRQAKRAGDTERAELLMQVLDDPDILELVNLGAEAEYDYVSSERNQSQLFGGAIQDFFQFLIENREEILAFILQIVQLFALLAPGDEA